MKTTVNFFRTLLLAVLTLTFGACGEDSLLAELGLDGQTSTKVDGAREVWDGTVAGSFTGGSGTAEDPYLIADGAQLARFAAIVNGTDGMTQNTAANGKLTADIVLNDISNWESWNESTEGLNSWTPIGNNSQPFTGTLDGDGHSVSGIYISTANYQGLVGFLDNGGTLQNLGVKASYIKGGGYVGGLCGWNTGNVTNCYNSGSLAGSEGVGGLCGWNTGNVTNCYNTGSVEGDYSVGGVCGYNDSGPVTNCYNTGSVTGNYAYVGGLCGQNYATVTNCYNTGSVSGNMYVGGVCGTNGGGNVTNCYNTGKVTGSNDVGGVAGDIQVGGVCGYNYATVTNCYYLTGTATGGIGYGSGDATEKTADQFKSGAVAYLLQNGQAEQIWGQNISFAPKDTYPVLGGLKVVQNGDGYANELKQDGDFYLISNADELRLFASMVNGGQPSISAKLTADIELNNTTGWENWGNTPPANSWTPIGNSWENQFTGTLDGDGHSVSGIYINSTEIYQGLVGYLGSGGTLQNLGVKASYIKGGYSVGGVCGRNDGTVTNCYNTGNVTGNSTVGGVCGENYFGTVTNCYNTGSVTGSNDVGGVCGYNNRTVTNCYNTGSVEGTERVGGVCGYNYGATVTNCYNTGSVTGSNDVGGLCGRNDGTVNNCYNTGSVTGSNDVGGLCGQNYATVTNCYYLNTCGAAGEGTSKTADEFASGEVAWLLQNGQTEQVWGQTIGKDDYPVPTSDASKKVYAYTMYQGQSTETGYANNNGNVDLDLASHPNTIAVFEASGTFAGKNIVVKDGNNSYTCAELVLTDDADFYTPVKFTAANATYTRMPKVWANGESGWETICLPFSGTLYAGEETKEPVLTDLAGDYWLRSLTGFKTPNTLIFASPATAADNQIEAGKPYLIALPGNTFGVESLEGQTISVRGTKVTVINTAQSVQPEGSGLAFTGTFATKACDAASYRLNSENGSDGAGDLFVFDTKELAPFRCRIDVKGLIIDGASTRSASGLPKELRIGQ